MSDGVESGEEVKALCFDYGAGNLHSLVRGLTVIGLDVSVATDLSAALGSTDLLILPGVGAFGFAAERLAPWRQNVKAALAGGLPCIGVCLGMQLLFSSSEEGAGEGVGLIDGAVTKLQGRRVPHIGWTEVQDAGFMYFAHSYACRPKDESVVTNWATHETDRFAAVVRKHNTIGIQFHPEKSSSDGVAWLGRAVAQVTQTSGGKT
ncbi:MAG: imidazole glycerol phosphate synthase subunit HisH [Polyangiaceae bacterium]